MSALPTNPVLLIGGTRGTGLLIARLLEQRGDAIRVMARDPERAGSRLGRSIDIVAGDLTTPASLPAVVREVGAIVFTAGVRSGRPAREGRVRTTEYEGVLHTLSAARGAGFRGRFLYMTSFGVTAPSLAGTLLNLYKGNTLLWRRRAEEAIRADGTDYTVIRAGFLLSAPGGRHAVEVTQADTPLVPRHRIARADVAAAFVAALDDPRASRTTFEIAWGRGPGPVDWNAAFRTLKPDARIGSYSPGPMPE